MHGVAQYLQVILSDWLTILTFDDTGVLEICGMTFILISKPYILQWHNSFDAVWIKLKGV